VHNARQLATRSARWACAAVSSTCHSGDRGLLAGPPAASEAGPQHPRHTAAVDPAVVGALIALSGVLLSGVLAYLGERRADSRAVRCFEWERVERVNQDRRDVYVPYLQLADSTWDGIARLRREATECNRKFELALVGEAAIVQDALGELENHRQHLTLIADLDTRREASRLQHVLAALAADIGNESEVLDTLERLHGCMRKGMGIGDFGGVTALRVTPSRRWQRSAKRLGMKFEP
jgi:hypothetical protein